MVKLLIYYSLKLVLSNTFHNLTLIPICYKNICNRLVFIDCRHNYFLTYLPIEYTKQNNKKIDNMTI
jgi:hypothetical protein